VTKSNIEPFPFKLNDANFLKRLREAVDRLVIPRHAKQQMRKRKITRMQIDSCLRHGRVAEPAHLTIHGDWKATIEHSVAGDIISVAVALERLQDGDYAVVVTVMR
jgi:hypothetical protein